MHCPLSGPDFIYVSLLIIPCIIYYVTNKETLIWVLLIGVKMVHTLRGKKAYFIYNIFPVLVVYLSNAIESICTELNVLGAVRMNYYNFSNEDEIAFK